MSRFEKLPLKLQRDIVAQLPLNYRWALSRIISEVKSPYEWSAANMDLLEAIIQGKPVTPLLYTRQGGCSELRNKFSDSKLLGTGTAGTVREVKMEGRYWAVKEVARDSIGNPDTYCHVKSNLCGKTEDQNCQNKLNPMYNNYQTANNQILMNDYVCFSEIYTEYLISIIVSDALRPLSINALQTFTFQNCRSEFFLSAEVATGSLADVLLSGGSNADYARKNIDAICLQIFHFVALYQDQLEISHNDLHLKNIYLQEVAYGPRKSYGPGTIKEYQGQDLTQAEYYHYEFNGKEYYIPAVRYIIKVGDFGRSVKWSHPIIASYEYVSDKWLGVYPTIYTPQFDVTYVINYLIFISHKVTEVNGYGTWFKGTAIYRLLQDFGRILNDIQATEDISDVFVNSASRLTIKEQFLDRFKDFTPVKVLEKYFYPQYSSKPDDGNYVTLGTQAPPGTMEMLGLVN